MLPEVQSVAVLREDPNRRHATKEQEALKEVYVRIDLWEVGGASS